MSESDGVLLGFLLLFCCFLLWFFVCFSFVLSCFCFYCFLKERVLIFALF